MPQYKLIGPIAQGGFGNVDRVSDKAGKVYARKQFSINQKLPEGLVDNVIKRFKKEAHIQASIDHQNIVPVLDHDLDADPPYYIMPVAESSLAKDIAADRTLGGHYLSAISDIVAGLEELHSMQIYHRDLKPQNVLRLRHSSKAGTVDYYAIGDFGLISMKDSQLSVLTKTGMARGSDYYTAPEITKDLRAASRQSDIYSLGCILHDMIGMEERVPCGEITEGGDFGPILRGCTRKNPAQRFKSVRAVLDAILSLDLTAQIAPNKEAIDFSSKLAGEETMTKSFWDKLSDFLDFEAGDAERRALCMALSRSRIKEMCGSAPEAAGRIAVIFAAWIQANAFNFELCDGLANRLELFIDSCGFDAKVDCLLALLEMGTSHNRWYVERMFARLCTKNMDDNLAKRLAVEMHVAGEKICQSISHLERSVDFKRKSLHPRLVKALADICT